MQSIGVTSYDSLSSMYCYLRCNLYTSNQYWVFCPLMSVSFLCLNLPFKWQPCPCNFLQKQRQMFVGEGVGGWRQSWPFLSLLSDVLIFIFAFSLIQSMHFSNYNQKMNKQPQTELIQPFLQHHDRVNEQEEESRQKHQEHTYKPLRKDHEDHSENMMKSKQVNRGSFNLDQDALQMRKQQNRLNQYNKIIAGYEKAMRGNRKEIILFLTIGIITLIGLYTTILQIQNPQQKKLYELVEFWFALSLGIAEVLLLAMIVFLLLKNRKQKSEVQQYHERREQVYKLLNLESPLSLMKQVQQAMIHQNRSSVPALQPIQNPSEKEERPANESSVA